MIKNKKPVHYDAYIPYTGFYALCSISEDYTPKTRNLKDVTCKACLKLKKRRSIS